MLLGGAFAGWIAARFVQAHGLGTVGDVIAGVVGAYIGNWVLRQLGFHWGAVLARSALNAAIGAIGCLSLVRFIRSI